LSSVNYLALTSPNFRQDPESAAGSKIAREMTSSTGITIAALLDRASEDKRVAEDETEEQRGKSRLVSLCLSRTSRVSSPQL
jgi:hypothetical protein